MSNLRSKLALLAAVMSIAGCSENSNINQIFVSKAQEDSLVTLIDRAQIAFDRAEYSDALAFAEKAEKISPLNEDIAVLLGYINLALAGMDTFSIARAMINASEAESKASKTALAETSSDPAAIFLNTIAALLKLDDSDIKSLGKLSTDKSHSLFKDFPVIIPSSTTKARASGLNAFVRINAAIAKICPFVDESVKLAKKDARYNTTHCKPSTAAREKSVVSHFLWAFSHIAEAAIFYSVVQYRNADAKVSNIQARASALESEKDSLSLSEYAAHVVALSSSVLKVYAFDDSKSQFSAIINDLTIVGLAFAQIGNVPKKIKASLTKALDSINSTADKAGSSADEKKGNALKAQLNKKLSTQLADQIAAAKADNPTEFAENKEDLCSAYATLSGASSTLSECK